MSKVVVLAGGSPHAHDFAATGAALAELATLAGHDVTVSDDPDATAAALSDGVDALVVDGLWWRMEGAVYDPWRERHAYSPPTETRRALLAFVEGGGGLLAVHTTSICFDDWPEWGDVVGGAWQWGVSSHPPVGPATVRISSSHPIVAGLPEQISLEDEVYGDLAIREGVEVHATARRAPDDDEQPLVWTHRFGAGRVVYDGLGHDAASIRQPDHARLLTQALAWITGEAA